MNDFNSFLNEITEIWGKTYRAVYEKGDTSVHDIFIPYVVTEDHEFITVEREKIISDSIVLFMMNSGAETLESISCELATKFKKTISSLNISGLIKMPIALKINTTNGSISEVNTVNDTDLTEKINKCIHSVDSNHISI